ncbi:hypothetical protein [Microterricola pindariensis]|uniref:Integral membrane protein n=1 Tax=Microterricola pindariensis TaxID=478010 RepID=A0ABX5AYJ5_9MICO|nr:hypothetical protein [Microterricola pindariensis]PPL19957.1 hypothetical protein GY24_03335 [Microterricola pindariensis]
MGGNELEVRERADATGVRGFARSVVTESAVYGVILVSAMVIVTGQKSDASIDVFLKVLGTVIVFWIAHIFAEVVGGFGATGGDDAVSVRKLIAHGVQRSWGLLAAALIPLGVILLGTVGVLSDDAAVWAALWVDVVLLGVLGYLAVARRTRRQAPRVVGALLTAALGVGIMLLKAFIH